MSTKRQSVSSNVGGSVVVTERMGSFHRVTCGQRRHDPSRASPQKKVAVVPPRPPGKCPLGSRRVYVRKRSTELSS